MLRIKVHFNIAADLPLLQYRYGKMLSYDILSIYLLLIAYAFPGVCYGETFRAAVYEHAVILPENRMTAVPRQAALREMMKNLDIYKSVVEDAKKQGADIIVLPEDGIYGMGITREALRPYLEDIPDPKMSSWNPCTDPDTYPESNVQQILSCLARNNSLYLVANFGDIKKCDATRDTSCPKDGHYQYNTNVVYDPSGLFIARYHKINLFYEFQFDFPKVKDLTTFDTPFGKFGVFTCFDIIFRTPAVDIIEQKDVRNIVFPTAWMDTQPLLTSVQFHSAFAAGANVNFLAANIHLPAFRFHGSGIYTPDGPISFYHNKTSDDGKLLVSDVPVIKSKIPKIVASPIHRMKSNRSPIHPGLTNTEQVKFNAVVFGDVFNFIQLSENQGQVQVCQNDFCCDLTYNASISENELYAFGAFDGLHTREGSYYIQVCVVLKCKTKQHSSCGAGAEVAVSKFSYLKMTGNFNKVYIFPEILTSGKNSISLAKSGWRYDKSQLLITSDLQQPLISAALFSRDYDLDNKTECLPVRNVLGIHGNQAPDTLNSAIFKSLQINLLLMITALWLLF